MKKITVKFDDGSNIDAKSKRRIHSVIVQKAIEGKKATEFEQDGAKVNLENLKVKEIEPIHANYIESTYKDWKIRVWRIDLDEVYGCNYFKDKDVRYLEIPFKNVYDENDVFKYAESIIVDFED